MTVSILGEKILAPAPSVEMALRQNRRNHVHLMVNRGQSVLMSLVEVYETQDGTQYVELHRERAKRLGFVVIIDPS